MHFLAICFAGSAGICFLFVATVTMLREHRSGVVVKVYDLDWIGQTKALALEA